MPPFDIGVAQLFQSTLSMRRAIQLGDADAQMLVISIHALHEESDIPEHRQRITVHFNPRSP